MERVDERDIQLKDKIFFLGLSLLSKITSREEMENVCAREFDVEVKSIVEGVYCYPSWFVSAIDRVMSERENIYGDDDG